MRNPALRLIGFGAAALMFVSIFAVHMAGEAQRQALAKREMAQARLQQQQQRMRARAPARARATPAVEEDWRSQDYDSVRYQPESRTDSSSYDEPRAVIIEGDDRAERSAEQRRTDAEADRLTRQLDSRLYGR